MFILLTDLMMFKIGSEVICIFPGEVDEGSLIAGTLGLTLYKSYKVIDYKGQYNNFIDMVHIKNDRNETQSYSTFRFVTLAGYRKLKLKKLDKDLEI